MHIVFKIFQSAHIGEKKILLIILSDSCCQRQLMFETLRKEHTFFLPLKKLKTYKFYYTTEAALMQCWRIHKNQLALVLTALDHLSHLKIKYKI